MTEKTAQEKIDEAVDIIAECAMFDGGHHKQWVLDQVLRTLLGDDLTYQMWIQAYKAGEDGPDTYGWDEGIAP